MKHLFLLLPAFFAVLPWAKAQYAPIPNGGFENWIAVGNYQDPVSWSTLNSVSNPGGVLTTQKDSTTPDAGMYSLKLITRTVPGTVILPGVAVCGTFDYATATITGGFPFTQNPPFIIGRVKFKPAAGGDAPLIIVVMSKWNTTTNKRDTLASSLNYFQNSPGAWRKFSVPLTYTKPGTPDTCMLAFSSSDIYGSILDGSYAYFDQLSFSNFWAGLEDVTAGPAGQLRTFPNPATGGSLHVEFSGNLANENSTLCLFDVSGRQLQTQAMKANQPATLSTENLAPGIYFLEVSGKAGMAATRLVVQ